jgi:hypothetical protein
MICDNKRASSIDLMTKFLENKLKKSKLSSKKMRNFE